LKKPFEATLLPSSIGRFVQSSKKRAAPPSTSGPTAAPPLRSVAIIDPELVRAAVTVALDAAMPAFIDQVTERVVAALAGRKPNTKA
jgi:hypothetical protein